MKSIFKRQGLRLAALSAAAAMLVGACASGGDGDSGLDGAVGAIGSQDGAGDPADGGSITFGSYGFPASLDPTMTQIAGSTGGTELSAIYDVLVRTDEESQGFQPQLAESLSNNDDYTEFTITLRDNTTFSDGTPLDSEAVESSINRFLDAQAPTAQEWRNAVADIETPDAATVVFTLNESWKLFPTLLSMGPGMIVGEASDAGDRFSPVGAGPFTVTNFAPNEELVLTARDDYANGRPHLDSVRFVPTSGASAQYESLQSGQLDMAYVYRDEKAIEDIQAAGFSGYLDIQGLGSIALINNREDKPGADVRVRQAIAHGIDPEVMNERVNNGLGIADSAIVPDSSRWYTGSEGVPYDPEEATELLDEAKADGYDGKLTYLAMSGGSGEAGALATQAALNSIGFDVTIDYASSVTDITRKVYVENDFDLTRSGLAFMDEAPYLRLYSGLGSDSRNNAAGYADEETDELLTQIKTSTSEQDTKDAIDKLQERTNETVPYAIWGPIKVLVAWDSSIHGVHRNADNIVLLDSAWIDQD